MQNPNTQFFYISHRGFGKKSFLRYQKTNKLQSVANQLTGLELGLEKGANTLEIDLCKTKDGEIITAHPFLLTKQLQFTKEEYLSNHPEALTFNELVEWFLRQNDDLYLYLELKSFISIKNIIEVIDRYKNNVTKNNQRNALKRLYSNIFLYTHNLSQIKSLLSEKQHLKLTTMQLPLFWVFLPLVTKKAINEISNFGSAECKLCGIEQGMIPWGLKSFLVLLSIFGFVPPFQQMKYYLSNLEKIVSYAHTKNLLFFV